MRGLLTVLLALSLATGFGSVTAEAKSIFEKTMEDQGISAWKKGDFKRARRWLSTDETAEKPLSWYYLGLMYENGQGGFDIDIRRAEKLYHRAAEKGIPEAMLAIADIHARGGAGVRPNSSVARAWHERAADAGSLKGMMLLAYDYAGAHGLPPDYQRARIWFEQVAATGNGEAMNGIANLYRNGHGVDVNMVEALKWYRLAVKYGYADAAGSEALLSRILDPAQQADASNRMLEWEILTGRAPDPNAVPAAAPKAKP
ncbi:MAG: tetratricopeptide repeat protein [Moraxellaceae bacterium]|nr:tetratricopeptide repeat protein [Moraxellaceae bacterium]